ncbi:MAG: DUF4384 domain-containing protein, partial [Desulfovibrio sp.]|nr:DUF4384 domain-containing protein [Desulfovibrio sp.]
MQTKILTFSLALVLALGGTAFSRTTRDLVFEEDEEPAAQQQAAPATSEVAGKQSIGIKTTVVLERDGQTSTVAPSHEFKSGDKVKLVFTPSVDGYVYWMAKGTSGQYQMLFPSAKAGSDNHVKRNQEYTVPVRGGFRFDSTPGSEELLCILSTERLNDLDGAVAEQLKNASTQVAALEQKHEAKRTTRDLVFEE